MTKEKKVYAKKIKRPELTLETIEIKEKVKDIFDFLRVVHPSATKNEWKEGAIEIRFLLRGDGLTSGVLQSFNTWTLDLTEEEKLIEKLEEYNGYSCCVYYSLYTYDRSDKSRKIKKSTALYTETLMMDFDGISAEKFEKEKQRLLDLNIETLDISSGHGYQVLILLDEKCHDTNALTDFTALALRKGFKVDKQIKDSSRVARLPYTFNCKEYCSHMPQYYNPDNPKGIETFIQTKTEKRYKLSDIFAKFETLEDVPVPIKTKAKEKSFEDIFNESPSVPVVENTKNKPTEEEKETKKEKEVFTTGKKREKVSINIKTKEEFEELYKHINYAMLPEAVQNLLMGTPIGNGDAAVMFLVPYLKNSLGLSVHQAIETMQVWGDHCDPPWTKEEIKDKVSRLYKYNFNGPYGEYTEGLQKLYGKLDFVHLVDDDEILIPNEVFKSLKVISDGAFRLYLAVRLLEHETNRKNFTVNDIIKRLGVTEPTFYKHIDYITKEKLVVKKKWGVAKREFQRFEYYSNPFTSLAAGFTKIKTATIELLLEKKFTGGEEKFYLYMKFMTNNNKECWASQNYIADAIGKRQPAISMLTDRLHEKRFVVKTTDEDGQTSTYRLLK